MYNRGIFDNDPEFPPAWSRYHRLREIYTQRWWPLHAVWLVRERADFEEARQRVLAIIVRVLRKEASPFRVLAEVLGQTAPEPLLLQAGAAGRCPLQAGIILYVIRNGVSSV